MAYQYNFTFLKSLLAEKDDAAHPEQCVDDTTVYTYPDLILFGHLVAKAETKEDLLIIAENIDAPQSDVNNIQNL